ncbi:MAG: tetraacyldisaccharide 4'-kinase [Desulfomonilia bacterium]
MTIYSPWAATTQSSILSSSPMRKALSHIYGLVITVRNILYDARILRTLRTPPVVISIGNIEVGGTGKTPFAMALAEKLKQRGYRCAIITRGYRGRLTGPLLVTARHLNKDVGDEALLMARMSGVPVVKSPDRVAGAQFASRELGCDIVILDDGFQHRRIHRDLDIVLVSRDIEKGDLLPLGHLREPPSCLKRANYVISTKENSTYPLQAHFELDCLVDLSGTTQNLSVLSGKKLLAFCGIARPGNFLSELKGLGAQVTSMVYADHHTYSSADIERILEEAKDSDLIVTTEKDMVKIDPHLVSGVRDSFFAVRIGIRMDSMGILLKEIEDIVQDRRISRQG